MLAWFARPASSATCSSWTTSVPIHYDLPVAHLLGEAQTQAAALLVPSVSQEPIWFSCSWLLYPGFFTRPSRMLCDSNLAASSSKSPGSTSLPVPMGSTCRATTMVTSTSLERKQPNFSVPRPYDAVGSVAKISPRFNSDPARAAKCLWTKQDRALTPDEDYPCKFHR